MDCFPEELKRQVSENITENSIKLEYAFPRLKKLPLNSKRNLISAINHFFNVKGTTLPEKREAYKKILNKAKVFEICTMGFIEQCKNLLEINE